MMIKNSLFVFLLLFVCSASFSQIPIGAWRMHLPYNNALGLARMGNNLYVGTYSGLFIYDTEDKSIEVLNKINGLSDIGISAMAKHPTQDVLMVGYENGNLDLLMNNSIFNLRDVINSNVIGSKRINKIKFSGSFAYLACDFGMVVYNYKKREIRESNLLLGPNGTSGINVIDCAKFNDTIYALTLDGLKSVRTNQDFKNTLLWKTYPDVGLPLDRNSFRTIDSVNKSILITTNVGLHPKVGSRFDRRIVSFGDKYNVREFDGRFLVCGPTTVLEFNKTADTLLATLDKERYKKISRPSDVIYEPNGIRWVADLDNGLLQITPTDTIQILPNGPQFYGSFALHAYKDEVVLLAGGYIYPTGGDATKNPNGFAIFSDNTWKTYKPFLTPAIPKVHGLTTADYSRCFFNTFEQKLYFSTFGFGLMVKDREQFTTINDSTTKGGLCSAYIPNDCVWNFPNDRNLAADGTRISSATTDATGDLWVTNVEAVNGSVRRRSARDNTWTSISLPFSNGKFAMEIMADQSNFKWVRMAPGRETGNAGIWVLNSDGSKRVALNSQPNQGALPSNDVYDIAEDKSGYIWVGTSKGLAVFYNPYNAFFTGGITASTPIYPPEAGRPVLENDVVTAIEIDGANRKWVGTRSNGIWLFNADITQVLAHFTAEDSPLISNFIYDIAISKPTGEVFIATDKGLVSYQSDASENVNAQGLSNGDECAGSDIEVFPNPVKKGFDGTIAVRGLANNSEVKFITASGKLVHKTIAKGGLATWNGMTYDGNRAHPGIYLILSSTEDGKSNCVSKLAILN